MENFPSFNQNRTYHEAIQWLVAQLKTAAQEVPILNNALLNTKPLDV
jgi:predicted Ser/Thr protein kinase